MRDALFDLCRRFADAHVDSSGVAVTPVPGITLVRALHPGDLQAAIAEAAGGHAAPRGVRA